MEILQRLLKDGDYFSFDDIIVKKNRSAKRTCVAYELPWSQRFFLPLRGSGSLISCREKSRKTSEGSSETGVLTSRFFTYNWNPVYFPVSRLGYKKLIHVHDWYMFEF